MQVTLLRLWFLCLEFISAWQVDREHRPHSRFTFDLDPSAVALHDLLADRESQARARDFGLMFAHAVELFK